MTKPHIFANGDEEHAAKIIEPVKVLCLGCLAQKALPGENDWDHVVKFSGHHAKCSGGFSITNIANSPTQIKGKVAEENLRAATVTRAEINMLFGPLIERQPERRKALGNYDPDKDRRKYQPDKRKAG